MKVKELIAKLNDMPQEALVAVEVGSIVTLDIDLEVGRYFPPNHSHIAEICGEPSDKKVMQRCVGIVGNISVEGIKIAV